MAHAGDDQGVLPFLYPVFDVSGSGGKGGGSGRVAQEAPNTLHARQTARIIDALGAGQIGGLVAGPASVLLDGTPLHSPGAPAPNFKGISWDSRVGTNSQAYLADYPTAEGTFAVGVEVKYNLPITRTISDSTIDALRVTIELPALTNQNTSNGDLNGSEVLMQVVIRNASNQIIHDVSNLLKGKTTQNYQRSLHFALPAGGAPWTVQLWRMTPDPVNISVQNKSFFHSYSTIVSAKLSYPGVALVALTADAKEFGSSIPVRNYLVDGLLIKYPNNLNPSTGAYSGIWGGEFAYGPCNNPVWVLYDILTRDNRGQGALVPESKIDKWSFYTAGAYADQQVPDGYGGSERRFTFNGTITQEEEAYHLIQAVASNFRGIVYWGANKVFVRADMPTPIAKNVNQTNVIDGLFTYSGTSRFARHSAVIVSWNDPADEYRTAYELVTDPEAILKYGWKETTVTAVGVTSRGQANRFGRWFIDSEQNETETVTYTCSFDHATVVPGDLIKVADPHYAGVRFGGRVVSVSGTTITLDAPVEFMAGQTYTISVAKADGTLQDIAITTGAGTWTTLSLAAAPQTEPNFVWVITGTDVAPRTFRVLAVRETDKNLFEVTALFHDPNKYSRVEFGLKLDPPPYTRLNSDVTPPTNIVFAEESVNDGLRVRRRLRVNWTPPTSKYTASYRIRWSFAGGNYKTEMAYTPELVLDDVQEGTYEFLILATNVFDRSSIETVATYTLSLSGASGLGQITGVAVQGGGTVWTGRDMKVQWTAAAPINNGAVLRDYHVTVKDATTDAILRVEIAQTNSYTYFFDWNTADGGPRRSLKVEVRARDTFDRLGLPGTATLTNQVPALPTGVSLTGGFRFVTLKFTRPADTDYAGVLVWWSETAGFTPGATNLVADTEGSPATIMGEAGKTYYVRYAAYDDFGRTNLTVSGELSVSTVLIQHAQLADGIIESSNLIPALNTQIEKIPVIETAVSTETTARQNADNALAQQITTISATASTGFNAAAMWHFETGNDNWVATNCTTAWQSSGALRVTPTAGDHNIESPVIAVNGALNRFVRIKMTRVAGTGGGNHQVYFRTAAHNASESHTKTLPIGTVAVGASVILSFDMASSGDWSTAAAVTRIRFDPSNNVTDVWDIDWIAVGSEGPSVGTAILQETKQALVNADTVIAESVSTLQTTVNGNTASIQTQATSIGGLEAQYTVKTDVNGYVSGYGLATTVRNGTPTSSFVVSADRFAIAAVGATALNPTIPFIVTTKSGVGAILSFSGYASISKLLTGSLETESLFVGPNTGSAGLPYIKLDGPNAVIAVNNGTRDVVKMGKRTNGTYGFDLINDAGTTVFSSTSGFGAGVVPSTALTSGAGVNLLYNSDFAINFDGWTAHNNSTGQTITVVRNANAATSLTGAGSLSFFVPNAVTGAQVFDVKNCQANGSYYPCQAGQRYEISAYLGQFRSAGAQVGLTFLNASNAVISGGESYGNMVTNTTTLQNLAQYGRSVLFATAPAGAVTMIPSVRVTGNGGTNPYGVVTRAYLGQAGTNQTEASPWSPGVSVIKAAGVDGLGTLATLNNAPYDTNWNTTILNIPGWGEFAFLDSISSANIGTYIQGLAVGTAYIANLAVTDAKINTLTVAKLTSGFIDVQNINVRLGNILVSDSNNNGAVRVRIGHFPGVDYGIWIYNQAGVEIFGSSGLNGTFIKQATIANASIGNLVVDGRTIADFAATRSNGAIHAGVNSTVGANMASVTMTTDAGDVFVTCHAYGTGQTVAQVSQTGGGGEATSINMIYSGCEARILIDGTDVTGWVTLVNGAFAGGSLAFKGAVGAGAHSFTAQGRGTAIGRNSIFVYQLKK